MKKPGARPGFRCRNALASGFWQGHAALALVFAATVLIGHFAGLVGLPEKQPKKAFAEELLRRYGDLNARPDPINRCLDGNCYRPGIDRELQDAEQAFSRLVSRPAAGLKVIERFPEATMLRIRTSSGKREIYTVLRNRAHSNVAFMLGESLR